MKMEEAVQLEHAICKLASAITPDAAPGRGADGNGCITSLTEAAMDISRSLLRIAESIGDLADAVREGADK